MQNKLIKFLLILFLTTCVFVGKGSVGPYEYINFNISLSAKVFRLNDNKLELILINHPSLSSYTATTNVVENLNVNVCLQISIDLKNWSTIKNVKMPIGEEMMILNSGLSWDGDTRLFFRAFIPSH